jgi:hypothetical protein
LPHDKHADREFLAAAAMAHTADWCSSRIVGRNRQRTSASVEQMPEGSSADRNSTVPR